MSKVVIDKLRSDEEYYGGVGKNYLSNSDIGTLLKNPKEFGISREDEQDWFKGLGMVDDWYNAKRMIIGCINESLVNSYIDGSTLKVNIPTATTAVDSFTTFYGSTFGGNYYNDGTNAYVATKEYDDSVYGSAYVYLFANTEGTNALPTSTYTSGWHHPYSGSYDGESHPNSAHTTSWDPNTSKSSSPHLRASHWTKTTDDGNDTPYVALTKNIQNKIVEKLKKEIKG